MKAIARLLIVAVMAIACAQYADAQRRVNPVTSAMKELQGKNENRQPGDTLSRANVAEMRDSKGNIVLVDTISGKEFVDTLAQQNVKIPKMQQPLMYATAVSVDVWDPLMRCFGQKYGMFELSAELNLHNRYIPVIEFGLGQANNTPEKSNFTYKVPITPYFRVGCNYNFIYNSNPDYMAFAGVRFGWSGCKYNVDDVTITSDYWNETNTFNLPDQTCSIVYMQLLFGLRVKIWGPISMGWNFRYRFKLHEKDGDYGAPWYIPGYGAGSPISGSFLVTYTIPLKKSKNEVKSSIN